VTATLLKPDALEECAVAAGGAIAAACAAAGATVVAPGPRTSGDDLAALVAFLASAAGAYFSGCRVELR
jgi:hypothetical protein